MSKNYYAVKVGNETGIFDNWDDCSKQVYRFSGAIYKKFDTLEEAESYMNVHEALFSERYDSEEEVMESLADGEAFAYVDGSNLGDGSKFSWGIVLFTNEGKVNISGQSDDERFTPHRNVSGELFASVNATDYAIKQGLNKIIICHDFSGIRHWALGEWDTESNLAKAYKAFYQKAMKSIDVQFVKADGHTGDKFNEEADVLAKEALGLL